MKPDSHSNVYLKPGREQSVLRRHPWIFSGAINKVERQPEAGQTVEIYDSKRRWLARGSYSPKSQISVRLLTFDPEEAVDESFWRRRVGAAIDYRKRLNLLHDQQACRLVFSESDGLPGVIVDRYSDFLVCQFLSAGAEYWRDVIIKVLGDLWPCEGIFERSDSDSRKKEGYPARVITLAGLQPPSNISIQEHTLKFQVDVHAGHKTGFYLDQRLNRQIVRDMANGKDVLNAFSYTGGFGVAAAAGGAKSVVNIDTSAESLELARRNYDLNGISPEKLSFENEDVFDLFRKYRDSRKTFDMIVLDPPKFVASAGQLNTGARGYKDINLLAFKLLRPGGVLVTFSCSGYVKPDLFQKIVADAAIDAGVEARLSDFLFQSPDHPVSLNFPEALYLKGLVCRLT